MRKKKTAGRGMVAHAFNPSTREGGRGRRISEFEASLVYRVSSRTARAIQRNPVSKKQNQNKTKNKGKHIKWGLQCQRLSPLLSRWETWLHSGRHVAGEKLESSISGSVGNRKREILGLA